MTQDLERIIRNVPAVEGHGRYVVGAHFGQGVPVVTVYRVDDEARKTVNLCVDLVRATLTIVPSMLLKPSDEFWDTIIGMLHECGLCDERNRVVRFEDSASLMSGLDHFFELLETV